MDSEILYKLKQGDESAFKQLFESYYVLLCGFAYQIIGNRQQAEEIVDDAIFYLWEHRQTVEIKYSIRSYLMRSVRNRCLNELNSLAARKAQSAFRSMPHDKWDFLEYVCSNDEHPLQLLLEQELSDKLHDCIEQLPNECRAVFKKSRFEQKKNDEIAMELGISVNTVKYHIKKALASLREDLSDYLSVIVFYIFLGK